MTHAARIAICRERLVEVSGAAAAVSGVTLPKAVASSSRTAFLREKLELSGLIDLFASWVPRFLAPVVRYGVYAALDTAMLEAFGFPKPLPLTRRFLRGALRMRGKLVRWLPPRRTPHFFTDDRNRTHPCGYEIPGLGPPRLIAAERRKAEAAARETSPPR